MRPAAGRRVRSAPREPCPGPGRLESGLAGRVTARASRELRPSRASAVRTVGSGSQATRPGSLCPPCGFSPRRRRPCLVVVRPLAVPGRLLRGTRRLRPVAFLPFPGPQLPFPPRWTDAVWPQPCSCHLGLLLPFCLSDSGSESFPSWELPLCRVQILIVPPNPLFYGGVFVCLLYCLLVVGSFSHPFRIPGGWHPARCVISEAVNKLTDEIWGS